MKDEKTTALGAGKAPAATPADLVALANQSDAFEEAMARQIREKMAAGLTKAQAVQVCKDQVRLDAQRAKTKPTPKNT